MDFHQMIFVTTVDLRKPCVVDVDAVGIGAAVFVAVPEVEIVAVAAEQMTLVSKQTMMKRWEWVVLELICWLEWVASAWSSAYSSMRQQLMGQEWVFVVLMERLVEQLHQSLNQVASEAWEAAN
jgi:hypothetical protein